MHAAKQIRLSRNAPPVVRGRQLAQLEDRVDPAEAELRLAPDRRDVLDRGERLVPLLLVGHVGVEQGQVELDVHRLLEQLARQVEPALGRVDVLVEVEHQVVRHDRVAGGEERHEPRRRGAARPAQAAARSFEVAVQVDLLDGPGVLDRVAEAVVEVRVAHRPQGQVHPRVEQHRRRSVGSGRWSFAGLAGLGVLQGARERLLVGGGRRAGGRLLRSDASSPAGCASPGASAGSTSSSARTSTRSRYIELSLPIVGAARNRFSDWLWSTYGERAAAMSISARCGSSHAVRKSSAPRRAGRRGPAPSPRPA